MPDIFKKAVVSPFKITLFLFMFFVLQFTMPAAIAQPVTGVWKGKIDRKNVELKIIKNVDSITGTSYYYESANSYRRYSIKGYFDERDNSVVWWDDVLIEEKKGLRLLPSKRDNAYLSRADFNCPGGTKMYLNGDAVNKETEKLKGTVDLQKFMSHMFNDEWDFVIDNYTVGASDPYIIDSVGKIAFEKQLPQNEIVQEVQPEKTIAKADKPTTERQVFLPAVQNEPVIKVEEKQKEPVPIVAPLTIKEKFTSRSTQVIKEIPVMGDFIELRFYDNAEIDGDSISIFLNNQLLYQHIRLTDKPYTIKLAVEALQPSNDLVMVAENLGSIPPNTSYMVAIADGKRYEARLESTENSSAAIRFVRTTKTDPVEKLEK